MVLDPPPLRDDGVVVGFCYGRRWFDLLITQAELGDQDLVHPLPTHVYVRGADWAVEAVPPRVRSFVPSRNPHPQVREYALGLDARAALRARIVAQQSVGQLYNMAGLAVCLLYERTGIAVPSFVRWRFCSQLTADALRAAGLNVLDGLPDDAITPARLEGWVVGHGARLLPSSASPPQWAPPAAVHG